MKKKGINIGCYARKAVAWNEFGYPTIWSDSIYTVFEFDTDWVSLIDEDGNYHEIRRQDVKPL